MRAEFMASRKALLLVAAAATAVIVVGALLPVTATAKTYLVGDDSGWKLGVDYDAWACGKNFKVDDKFKFVYSKDSHNVVVVDEESYEACAVPSHTVTMTSGNETIMLASPHKFFFICGVEDHCKSGMKVAVNVQW